MTDEVSDERTTIKPTKDGFYEVRNLGSFTNSKGEELPTRSTLYLCRCGGSAMKPFCDNSHASNGFSGANEADGSKDQREDYSSGDLTIHDNRGICAHIGRCSDGLPSVFRLRTEPWIDPDGADAESVTSTVRLCPSGALSYSLEGEEHRDTERPAGMVVSKDGPYLVTGGIELEGAERGDGASREHYALCRCGRSRNKPFCDGSHWQGFKDDKN